MIDQVTPRSVFVYCAVGGHGGPVQSVVAVREGLSRYRYDWLAGAWSGSVRDRLCTSGDHVPRFVDVVRPKGASTVRAAAQLAGALRRLPPDVVIHANGLTELTLLIPTLATKRHPVVVWVHNYEVPRKAHLLRYVGSLLGGRLHAAAVSGFAARKAREVLGADREVSIIPNPLSTSVVASEREPAGDRLRIAYLGTDRSYKGFDYLIQTVEQSNGHEFDWIIASRPYATDRERWDRLMACEDKGVTVVGRTADVAEIYGRSDVVFVPSREESFCRVAAEALANGLFVVASDLEPLREFSAYGDTISFFPVADVGAAIRQLRDVAEVRIDERRARGACVAQRAAAALSTRQIAAALETLYDIVLEKEAPRVEERSIRHPAQFRDPG